MKFISFKWACRSVGGMKGQVREERVCMEITRRTDYAIRMLIALASSPNGECVPAAELARRQNVPYPLARGIISDLARAGFITSRRGSGGGVVLARPPADISVLSIVESIEGPVALGLCTSDSEYCGQVAVCIMHRVWKEAEAQLRGLLAHRSLAYLVETCTEEELETVLWAGAKGGEVRP
jgi:Rrf2 family iron-sulfur cluster assembly transcriptional regulator